MKTVRLYGQIFNPDGSPAKCATGFAHLSRAEYDDGIVLPTPVSIHCDKDGRFDVPLWPNSPYIGSEYRLFMRCRGIAILDTIIRVPNRDVNIDELL